MKFSLGTQFIFESLMFAVGEDGDLKMLPSGSASEHPTSAPSSTSGGTSSGLNPSAGLYIRTTKLVRGILIVTSTLRTFTGAPSSSSSTSSPSRDSSDDYPEIGPVHVGTLQRTTVSSLWWPQTGIGPATAPVDIPLLKDQRRLMPRLLVLGWFRI
jgi:hypothetical protein